MQLTLSKAIFCGLYWIMMFLLYNYKVMNRHPFNRRSQRGYLMMFVLLTCYSGFDFTGGDFYGYYHLYQSSDLCRAG